MTRASSAKATTSASRSPATDARRPNALPSRGRAIRGTASPAERLWIGSLMAHDARASRRAAIVAAARRLFGRQFAHVLRGALYEWYEDKVPRMAAAVAFYAVFSITPIVV